MADTVDRVGIVMGTERCLFIGGPDHLVERDVPDNISHYNVIERPNNLPVRMAREGEGNVMMTGKEHTYRKLGKAAGIMIMEHIPC